VKVIATPHGRGDNRDELKQTAGDAGITAESPRAAHGIPQVRDRTVAPAADLVAKRTQPAHVAAADSACSHYAAARLVGVRRRRKLDRIVLGV
jgi:hypothetical protein